MPYIANKPGTAYRSFTDKDTFTGDGSTVAFDMTYAIAEAGQNDLQVFVNDVRQIPGDDYTLGVDDTGEYKRITFTSAPTNSHAIVVLNPGTVQGEFSSVADNAVTTAKLFDGAVTNAKLTNSNITINGTSIALGASGDIVAGLDWQAVKTSSFTAVAGEGYFVNTSGGAVTVTLPASPSIGDFVGIVDYGGNASNNNITIARNGSNIQGVASDRTILQARASEVFVYSDSTEGWTVQATTIDPPAYISASGGTETTSGDFKIHTFTSSGCFTVSCVGNQGTTVDYLVVAGGAGGGAGAPGSVHGAGGGGAGGLRYSADNYCNPAPAPTAGTSLSLTAATYPITVGAGGAGQTVGGPGETGAQGGTSTFSTITSAGGGGGGTRNGPENFGGNGGSGGGSSTCGAAGSGNTPPVSPSQGNPGGTALSGAVASMGGGGGAGAAGTDGSPSANGPGGNGLVVGISGSNTTYAGGGGGGSNAPPQCLSVAGTGGSGGGGNGGNSPTDPGNNGSNGSSNTGGGAGGAGAKANGGTGGSGIVIIKYRYQ